MNPLHLIDLTGQLVLVHPGLPHDPATRQNEIGIIAVADVPEDEFHVGFQDNTRSSYASDALFLLKPSDEIHQLLANHAAALSIADLEALTQLDLSLRYGDGDREGSALQLPMNNPAIQPFCLDMLGDVITHRRTPGPER